MRPPELDGLSLEVDGRVATLTLNRPESQNRLSPAMFSELDSALGWLGDRTDLSCLVLAAAGETFSAGGDLRQMRERRGIFEGSPLRVAEGYRGSVQRVMRRLVELDAVTIASVHGPAIGAGCDLAFACDLRLASSSARFGQAYVNVGLISGDGGWWLMPRLLSFQRAAELVFTGRAVGAEEAKELGLVLDVVDADQLPRRTEDLAETVGSKPPHAVRLGKRLLREAYRRPPLDSYLELVAASQALAHGERDHAEAVAAFLERRPPEFRGLGSE